MSAKDDIVHYRANLPGEVDSAAMYRAMAVSVALSAAALFGIGAATSIFTGRSRLFSGARQLGFGLAAAAVTFRLGRLLGVSLS